MSSGTVYSQIRAFLIGAWSTTALVFENEPYSPQTGTPWVLVEVSGTQYAQKTIGAGDPMMDRWDEEGALFLHVMVPSGSGSIDARNYAWALGNLFRGETLPSGDLEFMDVQHGLGETDPLDANWYRITVSIDWRRVEAT